MPAGMPSLPLGRPCFRLGMDCVPALALPEEWLAFDLVGPDLVHGRRFIESAVQHGGVDVLALAEVFEGIAVENDQVREFAALQGADIAVQAQ